MYEIFITRNNKCTLPFHLTCRVILFCAFTFLIPVLTIAQKLKDEVQKKEHRKSKYEVDIADQLFSNEEYFLAAAEYEKVLKSDPSNTYALFRLAE